MLYENIYNSVWRKPTEQEKVDVGGPLSEVSPAEMTSAEARPQWAERASKLTSLLTFIYENP